MKTLTVTVWLVLSAFAAAPGVAAQAIGAGASGQCYNEDATNGGQAELRVDTEEGVINGLDPVPGSGGVTDALVMFATGTVEDGGNPGSACDRYDCFHSDEICQELGQDARYDYLAVDVRVGNVLVQVCYRGSASIAGDCPRHPTGPGA